jgi:hypothetical protein
MHAYYCKVATHLVYLHECQQLNPDCQKSFSHVMKMPTPIQFLESTILEFMKQFQSIGANVGSPGLRGHASSLGQNVAHVVGNNTMFERKGKSRLHNLMQMVHTMGWWL